MIRLQSPTPSRQWRRYFELRSTADSRDSCGDSGFPDGCGQHPPLRKLIFGWERRITIQRILSAVPSFHWEPSGVRTGTFSRFAPPSGLRFNGSAAGAPEISPADSRDYRSAFAARLLGRAAAGDDDSSTPKIIIAGRKMIGAAVPRQRTGLRDRRAWRAATETPNDPKREEKKREKRVEQSKTTGETSPIDRSGQDRRHD